MISESRLQDIAREANRYRDPIDTQIRRRLAATLTNLPSEQIVPAFEPWLAEAHRVLLESGEAVIRGEAVEIRATERSLAQLASEWEQAQTAWLADPAVRASVQLADRCLTALPDILTGRRKASQVIFPGSTLAFVEGIYKNNPVADFLNDALSEMCLRVLQARLRHDPQARVRILEVGAGTGGTSALLLQKLERYEPRIEEYLYTDVSKAFLAHAEQHYAPASPFLRTAIFNVEQPAGSQGLGPASFDVVVAANVLHATRNIARTLRNLKYTLRKNGVLLLNELTRKSLVTHVTFGLLDGWWLVEDAEIRNTGSPSLTLDRWRAVLQQEGYRSVLTPVAAIDAALGQQIIAAESDGVVRLQTVASQRATETAPSGDRGHIEIPAPKLSSRSEKSVHASALGYVLNVLSGALKLDAEQIDPAEPLGNYGVDSILIGQLTHRLQQDFAQVTTTLFFERQTARDLAAHLADRYAADLQRALQGSDEPAIDAEASVSPQPQAAPTMRRTQASSGIAIIGLGGRYPHAPGKAEFWANLEAGRDCITEIPPDRWPIHGFYEPDPDSAVASGRSYSKWGGFLDHVRGFDPMFFNISPREAVSMDPQERLFLTTCWELMEDAGYTRALLAEKYRSRVGVFVGITRTGFELYGPPLWAQGEKVYPRTSFSAAANRVSYFFDLRGPSMAIDTMCSSSLVAIHEACLHLRQGACRLAIAGGVNLYLHPSTYVGLSAARMLSKDGRCRSFSARANGFVPGEGVGAVLLKPLAEAVADGDRIYAVISGSSANHGGRTNGFTVPNPLAHTELIREAMDQAGIRAQDISYLESHGTGTDLGDPIEIAGLSAAFREDTSAVGYCSIGSVKSNIGHLEAAAGIAGLTKILLQFQQRMLVPSLHADELNPNARFDESPFIVQRRLEPWNAARRIAGISSLGAGGSNAHLIVEEYVEESPQRSHQPASSPSHAVVLSARTKSQLEQMAFNLRQHLEIADGTAAGDSYLCELAYTLQIGREALEERLGLVVRNIDELRQGLSAYLGGDTWPLSFAGRIKRHTQRKGTFASNEDLERALDSSLASRDLGPVLEAWVRGAGVDWQKLYSTTRTPRRIALPTYPFSTEEYWFAPTADVPAPGAPSVSKPCADAQVFTLHGSESFLSDHVIRNRKLLPAVMYLELARAATRRALGGAEDDVVEMSNVVWSTPIDVDANPKSLHIVVSQAMADRISIEFQTFEPAGKRITHAHGVVALSRRAQPRLDLAALREQMTRGRIPGELCYDAFSRLGIEYGPAHRGIRRIDQGEGQLLAEIQLSAARAQGDLGYILPPGMLDSALQSCIGLDVQIVDHVPDFSGLRAAVPFALHEMSIHGTCNERMCVWVRLASEQTANVRKLDVDVCNPDGRVVVQFRGYATRTIDATVTQPADVGATLLVPQWQPAADDATSGPVVSPADTYVVVCGPEISLDTRALQRLLQCAECVSITSSAERLEERFTECSVQLFRLVQSRRGSRERPVLLQVVVPDQSDHLPLMGLSALLFTATLEGRGILGQLVLVAPDSSPAELAEQLRSARATPSTRCVRYECGRRQVLQWRELPSHHARTAPLWRHDGVYLITGGRGQVAQAIVDELLQVCPSARIILCGRAASASGLVHRSSRLTYQPTDVTKFAEVESLIHAIRAEHGTLHGIIHAAGIHQDRLIEHKTTDEWLQVLAPKVSGAANLDRATADLPLDFFALWSSGAAVFGNAGQADYATANAFMDHFAQWRNVQVHAGRRTGHTISLNWPQWEAGGMTLSEAARARLAGKFELRPLSTPGALAAFYQGTHAMQSQLLVATGRTDRILSALNGETQAQSGPRTIADASRSGEAAPRSETDPAEARAILRQSIAGILQLRPQDIQNDVEFGDLGFDSVSLTELAQSLHRQLRIDLDPTVFFDHPVLEDFANHLSRRMQAPIITKQPVAADPSADAQRRRSQESRSAAIPDRGPAEQEPIAIVGMSAEFPMAPNIDAFWANLAAGKDCISEIPPERWSWQALFGDPQLEQQKTNVKWGGFIEGAACFDPLFFSISPREAELMDPQQRLLMTHVYWAIEEAGYDPDSLSGSQTGIFVGTGNSGYGALASKAGYPVNAYSATSVIPSVGPNRMSYFLNLHGPSVPIETACSSALVAIHEAVRAIRSGRCNTAIAGGVMTIVTPDGHISFSKAGMLSADGRCKAFSAKADGYVRGEGVGMLMLKPLRDALAEGAHIHGLIRGSAVNHGGKASSLTAPNPKAQAALLEMAYADAGIDPRTVTYIEAHGTGTELGDPIEINALKSALGSFHARGEVASLSNSQCGLGSVKSNIGHLEMAAGVAGVIKVLLQFRHRMLVRTLHCEEPNPYIDLSGTPFHIVTANGPWPALAGTDGKSVPRRAGVSSFGFGGVNAHLVLEEYVPHDEMLPEQNSPQPVLVPLSARTPERLLQAAHDLLTVLGEQTGVDDPARARVGLEDLAFTLQVGRAALEHRLAIVTHSLEDLNEKLRSFIRGCEIVSGLFVGQPSADPEAIAPFHEDEELREAVAGWFHRRKLTRLAALWVRGARLDWRRLHADRRPRRISLPGYPFARDKYWIADAARINSSTAASLAGGPVAGAPENPFSHVNTSDVSGLRFTTSFSGSEMFVRDHVIHGQQVLPGVVYLEMMRAAATEAWGTAAAGACIQLRNIVWTRQLVVASEGRSMHVKLLPQSQALRCEVVSATPEDSVVYAQCLAQRVPAESAETIDLAGLQARLHGDSMDSETCYRRFAALGLEYGSSHRAIVSMRCGSNEALAQLSLPAGADRGRYILHPSMMDAALQAAIGLSADDASTWVPFSVECITVFAPCTEQMWAWVRRGPASQSLDIDVCNEHGRICIAIRQLTCKALHVHAPMLSPIRSSEVGDPGARSMASATLSRRFTGREYFIVDHMNVVPGVALLEMVRAAASGSAAHAPIEFQNVVWPEPAVLAQGPIELNLTLKHAAAHIDFEINTLASRARLHAQGRFVPGRDSSPAPQIVLDVEALRSRCSHALDAAAIRQWLIDAPHGPSMMPLARLDVGSGEALGTLRLPPGADPLSSAPLIHPSMMHGVFLAATLFSLVTRSDGQVELPFSLESLRVLAAIPETAYVHIRRASPSDRKVSIQVAEPSGRVCVVVQGFTTVPVKRAAMTPTSRLLTELIETVAALARIPAEKVDSAVELSRYGLDSLGLTELTNALNRRYGLTLMPTVFFEHATLASLARYLGAHHGEKIQPMHEIRSLPDSAPRLPASSQPHVTSTEPLAVVGMSARLPGARDLAALWQHLEANADLITPVPESRWKLQDWPQSQGEHPPAGAAGFMDDADCFDSLFFGISPREAEAMDPQQRLFLETVWSCMEDAGYASGDLAGTRTGVFVGASTSDYRDLCLTQPATQAPGAGATFHFEIANRVSYTLGLHGPSEVIDTACSSSLIALHRAIQSIRAGECEAAFAGGVNLIANPRLMMDMSGAGMLSGDGRCKTFDRRADGYGRGEGVGAILIKPLSAAQASGDHIYALIRGSAVNHGGRATSPTAPNAVAQKDLLVAAYAQAGIAPSSVSYIETHGTGTQLGDPVEINALKDAFSELYGVFGESPAAAHCALGSVKTNIGHLEAAAGISAVLKVLLMLKHRRIPGNGQLLDVNPYVRLEHSPFYLARQTTDWLVAPGVNGSIRRAGVSSLGVGGSNAHVILEEWPQSAPADVSWDVSSGPVLVPLSAKSPERLQNCVGRLAEYLRTDSSGQLVSLEQLARTLQIGRDAMACRVAFVAQNRQELITRLERHAKGSADVEGCWHGRVDKARITQAAPPDIRDSSMSLVALEALARRWVEGQPVNWSGLYQGRPLRRLSLPSYPFARVRHWLPALPVMKLDASGSGIGTLDRDHPRYRRPGPLASIATGTAIATPDIVLAMPQWTPIAPNVTSAPLAAGVTHLVILCDNHLVSPAQIEAHVAGSTCLRIESDAKSWHARFTNLAQRLFEIVQDRLRHKLTSGERLLLQVVAIDSEAEPNLAALAALLKSAHQENPALIGQLVLVSEKDDMPALARKLKDCRAHSNEATVRYIGAQPHARRWIELVSQDLPAPTPWKSGGVYLITGGMGGLGQILAREILEKAHSAVVIVVGRSSLDAARSRELARLQARGFVTYEQVDVCDESQVESLIQRIVSRHGAVQGVIHAAGLHLDGFVINKSTAEFLRVLQPKVDGTAYLDRATARLDLDFFILFSSGTGAAGNAGQSDYALANAFMDEYAHYRNQLVATGLRRGATLSLNWSVWAEGGMQLAPANRDWLEAHLGIAPMDTASALQALYRSLRTGHAQVMVVGGDRQKIRTRVLNPPANRDSDISATDAGVSHELLPKVQAQLTLVMADLLKVPESVLSHDEPLEAFGLDSMMVTRLTQRLREELGDVPRTLFYEHRTLRDIAERLAGRDAEACKRWVAPLTVTDSPERVAKEPIAIIGMSGRYAAAPNLEAFWEGLQSGQSFITSIPETRWPLEGFYHCEPEEAVRLGKSYSKWGGFIEDFAAFDPLFFNLSAKDAAAISPQERLFLEGCWQALEDSAHCPSLFSAAQRERIGVYGAVTKSQANTSFAALVNRVSFFMDFQGPSVPVDTKCSGALVALHQACEALQRGEIDLAVVGAVNLYLEPETYLELAQTRLLADTPLAALFSASGRGFVPSEGVGAVVLKRLGDAERDSDSVLALVRGTAVNHNGRTLSFGVPDPRRQAAVVRQAWRAAQIDPHSITYVESSANGSEIGDAIEIAALTQAFDRSLQERAEPVHIGSLKSAMGHAEAASGMAQLAKVILQMQHRMICPTVLPPTDRQGREFVAETGPFKLLHASGSWNGHAPLRAGIHSVGAGGVNAHAIIEQYIGSAPVSREDARPTPVLFVVSARKQTALSAYLQSWRQYLSVHRDIDLERLAYTLQRGREALPHRFVCIAASVTDLIATLDAAIRGKTDARYAMGVKGSAWDMAAAPDETLLQIARRWLAGEQVEWRRLYPNGVPRVLNGLPTYPFTRKNYWRTATAHEMDSVTDEVSAPAEIAKASEEIAKASETVPADVLHVQQSVRAVIDRLLQFGSDDEIGVNDNFAEMGFDSVSIVQFVGSLSETLGIALEVTAPFNYPSIKDLAAHIATRANPIVPRRPLNLDSILMNLAQDDLDVDEALSLLDQHA